jgi:hypothetical protein
VVEEDGLGIGQLEQILDPGLVHHGARNGLQAGGGAEQRDVLRDDAGVERPPFKFSRGVAACETFAVGNQDDLHGRIGGGEAGAAAAGGAGGVVPAGAGAGGAAGRGGRAAISWERKSPARTGSNSCLGES